MLSSTGARIVHACGFDSIPHDLGALFTVRQLPDDVPITMSAFVRASGTFSGGTYHSAIRAFSRVRKSSAVSAERRKAEAGSRAAAERSTRRALPRRPVKAPDGRGWGLPLPTIDPVVVRRSARALPDVRTGLQLRPLRAGTQPADGRRAHPSCWVGWSRSRNCHRDAICCSSCVRKGPGPSIEQRERSWFKVRFRAVAGDRVLETEVAGGDPGYDETATMLAQSALCLAFDELPAVAGQLTTAQAMGVTLAAPPPGSGDDVQGAER